MKPETKQKLINKLKDWKLYVFILLPLMMFIASMTIPIWQLKSDNHSVSLYITALSLFMLSVILIVIGGIYQCFKYKSKRNLVAACLIIAFTLIFVGITVYNTVRLPELVAAQKTTDQCYQECMDVAEGDREIFMEKYRAWADAFAVSNSLSTQMSLLQGFTSVIYFVALCGIINLVFQKPAQDDENKTETDLEISGE